MREFARRGSRRRSTRSCDGCAERGVNAGYRARRDYPEHDDGLLVAITERTLEGGHRPAGGRRSATAIGARARGEEPATHERPPAERRRRQRRCSATAAARSSSARAGSPGGRAAARATCPSAPLDELIPAHLLRAERRPSCRRSPSPRSSRHYNRISRRNFDLDTGFYPLGSCTMKHNPQLERARRARCRATRACTRSGARARAGRARADVAAGALARRDLRPAARDAAAVGGRARRARRAAADRAPTTSDRGEPRTQVLIPDTAHGTNPASVHDGRLRGGQGRDATSAAASTSTTCARRSTRTSRA